MFALVFLLLLIPELYIWYHFLRDSHWVVQTAVFMPWVAVVVLMALMRSPYVQDWMFRSAMVVMLCFIVPMLLFMLVSCLGWILRFMVPAAWKVMNCVGIAFVAAVACIIAYGLFVGWKKLVVHEVDLTFKDLPAAFDGYRIVQLSDFHIGTYKPAPECVANVVEKVNALNPDMVCFTGDLVNSSPEELDTFMNVMNKMKAKDGVFSIMGNHDYCMYRQYNKPADRLATVRNLQQRETGFGWDLLLNEHRIIRHGNDSIMLVGVENSSNPPFPDYGDLKKAMSKSDGTAQDVPFKILLSHDPTHWQRKVLKETDIQLQLSGHTHSTQFKIFGWSPAAFTYKEYAGLYEMLPDGKELFNPETSSADARKLFVCTGTGGNVAFRFGVWPEIVLITLHKAR